MFPGSRSWAVPPYVRAVTARDHRSRFRVRGRSQRRWQSGHMTMAARSNDDGSTVERRWRSASHAKGGTLETLCRWPPEISAECDSNASSLVPYADHPRFACDVPRLRAR